jgi:hypothetical protein
MVDVISVGISLPKNILDRIDSERQDVSRSRYLRRIIQNTLLSKDNKECKQNCGNDKANQGSLDVDLEACNQASPRIHKRRTSHEPV